MSQQDVDVFRMTIQDHWSYTPGKKVTGYVGKFTERVRQKRKIIAKVQGNHGVYTVSIEVQDQKVVSTCSCYIGGSGGCHHCHALAITFLQEPKSFKSVRKKGRDKIETLDDLRAYLKGITLESLLEELKSQGITQKALAESIGMNPRHLGSIKSCELRNRYYNELGATKLACLWVLEHIKSR
jgi:uncharacterized Zn finger protein